MRKLLASILFAFTILTGCAEPEIIISDLSAKVGEKAALKFTE